ncbi:MAG TPA: hypothetical protein VIE42_09945 [Steroidobacteraceae bacterium]
MNLLKPGIACLPLLLALSACVHERGGSPAAAPAQTPAAPEIPAPPAAASRPPPAASAVPAAAQEQPHSTAAPVPPRSAPPPPASHSGAPAARVVPPARPASVAHAAPVTPAPAARPASAAPAAPAVSAMALDLKGLEQRLRDTRAIGVFTKLSLKNQVDDLLAQFKAFHGGQSRFTLTQLRQSFEVLLMKVVSVLQGGDPALATAVSASREAIWGVLKDPQKFAAI